MNGLYTGQHLVDDHAERKHIRPRVALLAPRLFRSHVADSADNHPGLRGKLGLQFCGERLLIGAHGWTGLAGQAEVEKLDGAIGQDEDVLRFQIAVDDAAFVRGAQSGSDLPRDADRLVDGHRSKQLRAQRPAREQLADDERHALLIADVEDRERVWMGERRDDPGLAAEAIERRRIEWAPQHLDRHLASESRVGGAVDLAHAARADQREDAVGTESCAFSQGHYGGSKEPSPDISRLESDTIRADRKGSD